MEVCVPCCDSDCMHAVLSKLMPPQTFLDESLLSRCSSSAIQLVSQSSPLTFCVMMSLRGCNRKSPYTADTGFMNLTPLSELSNLTLFLSGANFDTAQYLEHLTHVELEHIVFVLNSAAKSSYATSV